VDADVWQTVFVAQKLLRNSTCVFCRERLSSRHGEHVHTTDFIQDFFPDKDEPYSFKIGGRAVLKSDGSLMDIKQLPSGYTPVLPAVQQCAQQTFRAARQISYPTAVLQ
jgi:hypothetical protein